jgi:hypothetical protein
VGTVSENFITLADWYPTFCYLAGVDTSDAVASAANLPLVDGYNMWPLLTGTNTTNPRTEIPIGIGSATSNGPGAYVRGLISPPYKLVYGAMVYSFWQGTSYPNTSTNSTYNDALTTDCTLGCLYNILTDPTEHHEISAQFPSVVATMMARIGVLNATVFNADRGPLFNTCATAQTVYNGFFGPFVTPTFNLIVPLLGYFSFVNASGYAATYTSFGSQIAMLPYNPLDLAQQWFQNVTYGQGYDFGSYITSRYNSTYVWDVFGADIQNGIAIIAYIQKNDGSTNQLFVVTPTFNSTINSTTTTIASYPATEACAYSKNCSNPFCSHHQIYLWHQ